MGPLEREIFVKYCKRATSKISFNNLSSFFSSRLLHCETTSLQDVMQKILRVWKGAVEATAVHVLHVYRQHSQVKQATFQSLLSIVLSFSHATPLSSHLSPALSILLFPWARSLTLMGNSDAETVSVSVRWTCMRVSQCIARCPWVCALWFPH